MPFIENATPNRSTPSLLSTMHRLHILLFISFLLPAIAWVSEAEEPDAARTVSSSLVTIDKTPESKAEGLPRSVAESQPGFVEPDFPFFSSVLDAKKWGEGWPADNLTSRGLILRLGHDCWACFDTDLLRISAIWRGQNVTANGMAYGSYEEFGKKAQGLAQIVGEGWLANGIYAGWQLGDEPVLEDPREEIPGKPSVGRGPLPFDRGRFNALRLTGSGVRLEYRVGEVAVEERIEARLQAGQPVVQRSFTVGASKSPLLLMVGRRPTVEPKLTWVVSGTSVDGSGAVDWLPREDEMRVIKVNASNRPVSFAVACGAGVEVETWQPEWDAPAVERWPQQITTQGRIAEDEARAGFALDHIALPVENPWRRQVRLADMAVFRDGTAAAVTYDGDVWMIEGLDESLQEVRWKRFASGLHEPLSLVVRGDDLLVFDRNGIWRLRDTDGNGEADVHELFSSAFTQTEGTREYASSMRLAPDGTLIISKGGQATDGRHNGTVLRVAADGNSVEELGWGLRGPFVGVHPRTGLVTASDQQGNYVPATPLHIIRDGHYHGYLSNSDPKEQYPAPISEPLLWIPHVVNASGVGQVWLADPRMGPMQDVLVHIGYYRPDLFAVRMNERGGHLNGFLTRLDLQLDFPPLTGVMNPADGHLYVTGFQIWGTVAKQISGLARMRYIGGESTLPRQIVPMDQGVLLTFDAALDEQVAVEPGRYYLERWNYQRTPAYGSPHFKLDGTKGQELMVASSVYLSRDRKSVFLGIPDMNTVMQMRLSWSLTAKSGLKLDDTAYFSAHQLVAFRPEDEGFDSIQVDLTPKPVLERAATPVTVEEGERLAALMGCIGCHTTDGTIRGGTGPSWLGLYGSTRKLIDGSTVQADEAYLRESILDPASKILKGFEPTKVAMPSYDGIMTESQVGAVILYMKTLEKPKLKTSTAPSPMP